MLDNNINIVNFDDNVIDSFKFKTKITGKAAADSTEVEISVLQKSEIFN